MLDMTLLTELRNFPEEVDRAARAIPGSAWTRRPVAGGFSMSEHACHLRDYEMEGVQARIRRILAESDPVLADFEGDRLARERDYQRQDGSRATLEFASARSETVRMIEGLSEEQLARTALFGEHGRITLTRLLEIVGGHDASHREELRDLVAELRSSSAAVAQG